jgi:hypothetical protein
MCMPKHRHVSFAAILLMALVGWARPAVAGPIIFTDRAAFYAAIGDHTVATFDDPQACERVRFSCSITEDGIIFSLFAEVVPEGSIIVDHLQTTLGSAVFATFPSGTTAVGFDVAFPPGVGATVSFSPAIGPFDITTPGFFGIVSTDVALTTALWSRLQCCEGEVEIDNVTVNTVPEAAPLQLFGSAVLVLLVRRRPNHSDGRPERPR